MLTLLSSASALIIGTVTGMTFFVSLLYVMIIGSLFFNRVTAVPLYFPPVPQSVGSDLGYPYVDMPTYGINPLYFMLVTFTVWTISIIIAWKYLVGGNVLYILLDTIKWIFGLYLMSFSLLAIKTLLSVTILWLVGPNFFYFIFSTIWGTVLYYIYKGVEFIMSL